MVDTRKCDLTYDEFVLSLKTQRYNTTPHEECKACYLAKSWRSQPRGNAREVACEEAEVCEGLVRPNEVFGLDEAVLNPYNFFICATFIHTCA